MYKYSGKVTRVLDINTLEIEVDLGFDIRVKRVFGVEGMSGPTFKDNQEEALRAKDHVKKKILGSTVLIETTKLGKFGRYTAKVYVGDDEYSSFIGYI